MEVKEKVKRHASIVTRTFRCKFREAEDIKLSEVEDTSTASLSKPASLARVVGDPFAAEKTWMAACTVAGSQSLANHKRSSTKQALLVTLTVFGGLIGCLSAMLLFPISFFLVGHLSSLLSGTDMDAFMKASRTAQGLGFYIGLLANTSFWLTALQKPQFKHLSKFIIGSTCALLVLTLVGSVQAHGLTLAGALILGTLALLMCAACQWMGGLFRDNLPKTLSVPKLFRSTLWALLPPALLCAASITYAITTPSSPDSSYSSSTSSGFAFFSIMMAYCAMVPGFCMALASKSRSLSGCVFLSVVTQIPILLGLGLTAVASFSSLLGFIPRDPVPSLLTPLCLLGAFALATALTALGGAAGASFNKGKGQ